MIISTIRIGNNSNATAKSAVVFKVLYAEEVGKIFKLTETKIW